MSGLVENKSLLHQVIPKDQSFSKETYAGIFDFIFGCMAAGIDVVIDDRLPYTASDGKLLFSSNNQQKIDKSTKFIFLFFSYAFSSKEHSVIYSKKAAMKD